MRRHLLIGLFLFAASWAMLVSSASSARAQSVDGTNWFGLGNSEKVHSKLMTPIGSGDVPPYKVKVTAGDGQFFLAALGIAHRPIVVTIAPAVETPNTVIEEDTVSDVVGDSLTISGRAISNTSAHAWLVGSYIGLRVSYAVLLQMQDSLRFTMAQVDSIFGLVASSGFSLPSQTGQAGKTLTTNGSVLSWTLQPGSVVPVTLGGTGLTTLAAGKLWYASATNTIAPLSLGTGLAITGSILNVSLAPFTTTNLAEGTNLYFTDARVLADISGASPVNFSSGTITVDTASATTTGVVTSADFNTLMAKQNALTIPLPISLGGSGATTAAAALNAYLPDSTGLPDSVVLGKTHAGYNWVSIAGGGGGSGTMTSVTVTVPSILAVTPATITNSGTFAVTLATESANTVLSGPTSGSAATPTFRTLVAGDIPSLNTSKITSGTLPIANGGTNAATAGDALNNLLPGQAAHSGEFLTTNGTNTSWGTPSGSGTVTSVDISGGTTGLTPSGGPITGSGVITLGGTLGVPNGGTGAVTFSGILKGNGTSAVTAIAIPSDATKYLDGTGAFSTPAGSGTSNIAGGTAGAIPYQSAANTTAVLAATTTAKQVLLSGASAAPAWSTATYPATTVANNLLYSSATNAIASLATSANGVLATNGSGVPSITSTPQLGAAGSSTGSLALANSGSANLATLTSASQAGARTYTIPDAGASASFVMTEGIQTINGAKNFTASISVSGDMKATSGNIIAATAGNGLQIKGGVNATVGTATLSSGTITVNTTAVTALSLIFLTDQTTGANLGNLSIGTITPGAGFVINSSNALDANIVAWMIVEKL